ncbi:MAG: redoxin domain-containing protein [Planctomycetes bacterium]|nr:redoxin domain-containing protein [Planctomycetota bacterium]
MRAIIICIIVVVGGMLARLAAESDPPTLAIGAKAPDFTLPGVDGKNHSLGDYAAAKVLAVVFTSNHCPTAQEYEERLKAIAADYQGKGVALVAISPNSEKALRLDELGYTDLNDSLSEMKLRADYLHFNFPYLYDGATQVVSRTYGPSSTPHAFVFDAARILRYEGRIDDNERESVVTVKDLRVAIDAVLAGTPVATPHTPSLGCSTKWLDKQDEAKAYLAEIEKEPVTLALAGDQALAELMANTGGKLRLINCWGLTCGPCVRELPELVNIERWYRGRDFELVTVSTDFPEDQPKTLAMLQKVHASGRNLLFAEADKYKLLAALDKEWDGALPYSVLIAPGGKVVYRHTGAVDPLALRRVILKNLK